MAVIIQGPPQDPQLVAACLPNELDERIARSIGRGKRLSHQGDRVLRPRVGRREPYGTAPVASLNDPLMGKTVQDGRDRRERVPFELVCHLTGARLVNVSIPQDVHYLLFEITEADGAAPAVIAATAR